MSEAFEVNTLRRGAWPDGQPLTREDREQLIQSYLPLPRHKSMTANLQDTICFGHDTAANRSQRAKSPQVSRLLLRKPTNLLHTVLHKIIFFLIQLTFSVYIHFRQLYHTVVDRMFAILYYHHRTPELIRRDIKALGKLPRHLSIIVESKIEETGSDTETEELLKLCGEVAEIAAWCACAGIFMLSIYEQTGILKSHTPYLHQAVEEAFRSYFSPDMIPPIHLCAPNTSAFLSPTTSATLNELVPLKLLLLSASDGRDTLVDLTKTLAEMSQKGKIAPSDISADLIDAEITESSCSEPDLLVVMSPSSYMHYGSTLLRGFRKTRGRGKGSSRSKPIAMEESLKYQTKAGGELCLQGYPPWQLRLTEIFYVQDNPGVGYQVFLRALHRYAKAQMRFGR